MFFHHTFLCWSNCRLNYFFLMFLQTHSIPSCKKSKINFLHHTFRRKNMFVIQLFYSAISIATDGPGIDSWWCHWGFFPWFPRQNHVPWGRLSIWKWVPGISSAVNAADAFGWRPTTLVVPNVKKIREINLPGTPWATSACRGRPLHLLYSSSSSWSVNYSSKASWKYCKLAIRIEPRIKSFDNLVIFLWIDSLSVEGWAESFRMSRFRSEEG